MAKAKKKSGSSHNSMRDRMRERATTREQSGKGGVKFNFPEGREVKFLKIDKAGTRKLDFLPYVVTDKKHPAGVKEGDLWYQRTIWTHNGIGPEEKTYLCLKTIGKKCPICEYAAQLQRDPKADEELVKSLKAKEREVFNVIDLDSKDDDILLWEFSYHLFGKLLEEEIRNAEPEEDYKAGFADLEGGSTLKIRFDKKVMGKNEFYEAKRIDFLERDDYDEDILDKVLPLDSILNVLEYKKLEAILLDTDAEDDEEEEKPRGRGSKEEKKEKPSRGRGKKEEEPEDEEPEDEEPPRRGGKKKDEKPAKKEEKSSRRGSKKEEPEDEEVDLDELDLDELKEYIDEHDLDIKVTKKMDEDDVRELIREAQGEAEEEEPEEKPKRGGSKKEEKKPAKKDDKKGKKNDEEEEEQECIGGGTFGEDEGEFDECMDCECWDECKEACAQKKKAKKGRR